MKRIELEELKLIQLDILSCVDKFCRANNISYSLAFGSLLGAIRHKGYIPWDDDIDIMMPRKDYNNFLSLFKGAYPHLEVMSPEIDNNYYAPYANVYDNRTLLHEGVNGHRNMNLGVKIDIFPMDYVPEKENEYLKLFKIIRKLNLQLWAKRCKLKNLWHKSIISFLKIFILKTSCLFSSYATIQKRIIQVVLSTKESNYVDIIVYPESTPTRVNQNIFLNYINVPFENYQFKSIKDYDAYLKIVYGDYMKLPPENERILKHNFEAYWIN